MGLMDGLKRAGRAMVMGEVDAISGMRGQKRLMSEGVLHDAECRSARLNWDRDEGDPRWGTAELDLIIDPRGEAREWTGKAWVRAELAKRIAPDLNLAGKPLQVRVDPADPQKVAVDWDATAGVMSAGV